MFRGIARMVNLRQVAPLAAVAIVAPLLGIIFLPVLLTQYGPAAYGHYALVMSVSSMLSSLATFRLETVIPTIRNDARARRLAAALFAISLTVSALVIPAGMLLHQTAGWKPGFVSEPVSHYATVAALTFLLSSLIILKSVLVRSGQVTGTAMLHFAKPVSFLLFAIVFGLSLLQSPATEGSPLLYASLLSLVVTLAAGLLVSDGLKLPRFHDLSLGKILRELKANRGFLSEISLAQFLNKASLQIPLWATAWLYDTSSVAWVALAQTIVLFPSHVAGLSLESIIKPRFRKAYHGHQPLAADVAVTLLGLILLGICGFGFLAVLAPWTTEMLFSENWQEIAEVLQIFCLLGFAYFSGTAIRFIPTLFRKSRYLLVLHATRLTGIGAVCVFAFCSTLPLTGFLIILVMFVTLSHLFNAIWIVWLVKCHDQALAQYA